MHPRPRHRLPRLAASLAVGLALAIPGSTSVLAVDETPPGPAVCGTAPLDIEIILDRSGSMTSESNAGHSRLYWAQQAADQLVDALQDNGGVGAAGNHLVGVTSFQGSSASVDATLASAQTAAQVKAVIDDASSSGNTPLKAGLVAGSGDLAAGARNGVGGDVKRVIILLSDGRPNPDNGTNRPDSGDISDYLATTDVAYSIAIGEGGSGASQVDLALMQQLDKPGGHYVNVVDSSDLPTLFDDIFSEIACTTGINVVKTASTLDLPLGPGSVTFTYTVTNTGDVDLDTVAVTDDKCSPVTFVSGDAGEDEVLGLDETWIYQCTKTVTETQTNTATASGCYVDDPENCAEDTDQVTVQVAGVAAETAQLTLPPTSTLGDAGAGASNVGAIAAFLAVLAAMALALTPKAVRRR